MQGVEGHSRKESDDFSNAKLFFGDDASTHFEVDVNNFPMDPALEPSLSFHQPKSSFKSSLAIGIWIIQLLWRTSWKFYVHPAGAVFAILGAILVPSLLGWSVVHSDYKERGEWLVIDKSLTSFQIPGHISSQREDMVRSVASKDSPESKGETPGISRRKRSAEIPAEKPSPRYQKYPKWKLELVYLATGDDSDLNIFTKEQECLVEPIYKIPAPHAA